MFMGPSVGSSRIASSPSRVSFMVVPSKCKRYADGVTKRCSVLHFATERENTWIVSADGRPKNMFLQSVHRASGVTASDHDQTILKGLCDAAPSGSSICPGVY